MQEVLSVLDQILRNPRAVAEKSRSAEDLRPLFVAALGALVLGAGVFGAVLATSRGGTQLFYSGIKLPLALLGTLVLAVPAFHAIAAALGRALSLSGMVGLTLAAAARAALVLVALAPICWFAFDQGLGYHGGVLLSAACYGIAGLCALELIGRGIGFDSRGLLILACFGAVLLPTGAQTAWMLRPFIGRPAEASVPFLRARESSFADAVYRSAFASIGDYRESPETRRRRALERSVMEEEGR